MTTPTSFQVPYWLGGFAVTTPSPATWTLPATYNSGGKVQSGEFLQIRNYGPGNITLVPTSPETIEFASSYVISITVVQILTNSLNWVVITPFTASNVTCGTGLNCAGNQVELLPYGSASSCTWPSLNIDAYGRTTCTSNTSPVTTLSVSAPLTQSGTATTPILGLSTFSTASTCAWANVITDVYGRTTCTANSAPLTSLAGTTNQISVSSATGSSTLSLSSTLVFPGTFRGAGFDLNFRSVNTVQIGNSETLQSINSSSNRNVAVGAGAGAKAALVQDSVLLGFRTGGYGSATLAVMRGIVAIGSSAAYSFNDTLASSATGGVYIGTNAGQNDIGSSNFVAIGYQAGYASKYCNGCMFIGDRSGYFFAQVLGSPYGTSSDEPNTFVGNSAGTNLASGQGNTALGFQAYFQGNSAGLPHGATGTYNTAIGTFALQNAAGDENTALGRAALYGGYLSSASYNVAVGTLAMYSSTSSTNSVAVGSRAMFAAQTMTNSTCLGYGCSNSNSTLNLTGSTAVGAFAIAGNSGSAFGYNAQAGNSCVALGANSVCTEVNTVILGSSSDPLGLNTFSYACIGCNGATPSNTARGSVSIPTSSPALQAFGDVTANAPSGTLSFMVSTTALSCSTAVVTNTNVATSSEVILTIQNYSGTRYTNGIPNIARADTSGSSSNSFTLRLCNDHATNALSGNLFIAFWVLN